MLQPVTLVAIARVVLAIQGRPVLTCRSPWSPAKSHYCGHPCTLDLRRSEHSALQGRPDDRCCRRGPRPPSRVTRRERSSFRRVRMCPRATTQLMTKPLSSASIPSISVLSATQILQDHLAWLTRVQEHFATSIASRSSPPVARKGMRTSNFERLLTRCPSVPPASLGLE